MDGLNNLNLFLTVLEDGNSKIKGPAGLLSGEALIPDLHMAAKQSFSRGIGSSNHWEAFQKAPS